MSKGFDPFKPLSINTSALESSASTSSSSTTTTVKKQSVLYESLQQHPLAKYHQTQQQHRQVMINNNAKYAKELDYFETLQETGVTNKV